MCFTLKRNFETYTLQNNKIGLRNVKVRVTTIIKHNKNKQTF